MSLYKEELKPNATSWLDANGYLLDREDKSWVFRCIHGKGLENLNRLFKKFTLQDLNNLGVVYTEVEEESKDYTVLKHEKLWPIIYPFEWTSKMWKEALFLFCDLNLSLMKKNFVLHDSHPFNISWKNGRPIFIDFGSIEPMKPKMGLKWHLNFKKYFLLPIITHNLGFKKLSNSMAKEGNSATVKNFYYFSPLVLLTLPIDFAFALARISGKYSWYFRFVKLFAKLNFTGHGKTKWTGYKSSTNNWKEKSVKEAYELTKPIESAIDLAGNKGEHAFFFCKNKINTILADIDEYSLDEARRKALTENLNLPTALLNICYPTAQSGLGLFKEGSYTRFNSDLVISLAVSHHLAFNLQLPFYAYAKILSGYAKKFILTEFIDVNDEHVKNWINSSSKYPVTYTQDHFVEAFKNENFKVVKTWNDPSESRFIYLFKKQ